MLQDGVETEGSHEQELVAEGKPSSRRVHVAQARRSLTHENGAAQVKPGGTSFFVKHTGRLKMQSWRMILHNTARLLVLGLAIAYVVLAILTVIAALTVLQGKEGRGLTPVTLPYFTIASYTGNGLINQSPLVQDVLQGNTDTNRSDAVYLQTSVSPSFTNCSEYQSFNPAMYGAHYLRFMFGHLKTQLAYNVTIMDDLELIIPVVDCVNYLVAINDITIARVYYLVRRVSDPTRLLLLSTSMSVQNYYISAHRRRGPGMLVSIGFIEDMTGSVDYSFAIALNYPYEATPTFVVCNVIGMSTDGFLQLQDVPVNPLTDDQRTIVTARRDGFYIDDVDSQSNIRNWHWLQFEDSPASELSTWQWSGYTQLQDSWAWTHCIHAIFAFNTSFQIAVLVAIIHKKIHRGEVWIGDAFASISSSLLYRGILVLVTNQLNGYYTWTEYTLAIAYSIAEIASQPVYYRADLIHADMLTMYLNAAGVLSYVFKERIHPLLAAFGFIIAFNFRELTPTLIPAIKNTLVTFAEDDYSAGVAVVSAEINVLAPFNLRTYSAVDKSKRSRPLAASLNSITTGLVWFFLFFAVQKLRRYMKRKKAAKAGKAPTSRLESRRFSGDGKLPSDENKTRSGHLLQTTKPQLTLFESATGSVLQSRFGVITDYDNYVTDSSGRRCATADAVYSSGFIILNRKFLVATDDLITIIIIKLTRMRFRNVFVYDLIGGDTPNQTARLLYPSTISWRDLMEPGISDLA